MLELWANGRRVCGIDDCDDNATLEQIVQQANQYEDVQEYKERIKTLEDAIEEVKDELEGVI